MHDSTLELCNENDCYDKNIIIVIINDYTYIDTNNYDNYYYNNTVFYYVSEVAKKIVLQS